MDKFTLYFIIFVCVISALECAKVSFFGASHIAMPLQEAKVSTNIRLKLRTSQSSGLVFLAAGRTNYCLLQLENGQIKLLFKIEDYLAELTSPTGFTFNDLEWHDLVIQRYESNITMQIDEHFVRKTIPIISSELNIHFGIFLGGVGDFSEIYLHSIDNFRGCLSDVFYNNINVLKRARERSSHVSSVHVSWTCSSEFEADEHKSISFVDDDAYVGFNKQPNSLGESWSLEFHTIEPVATVFYNPGSDSVALEIVDSKLRLLVSKGSNVVELIHDRNVSDGFWHNVTFIYSPTAVEITVDGKPISATFAGGSNQKIDLSTNHFLGGIKPDLKRRAATKGLKAIDYNFQGCIKRLEGSGKPIGFPHFKETVSVTTECIWYYPCLHKSPCIPSATCHQHKFDNFMCDCEQAYCIKADYSDKYTIFTRVGLPQEREIVSIYPLEILEGGNTYISPKNIELHIDYDKYGISEEGVMINVVHQPKQGMLSLLPHSSDEFISTQTPPTRVKYFSLGDLKSERVKYTHNGSELLSDHITMDLQFISGQREKIPEMYAGKHRFILHVNVTPVNDPPTLKIPSSRILRLTQGIPKLIKPDLLTAEDPDSPPSALLYTLLASPYSDGQYGRLEVRGKAVNSFTQADVDAGIVTYLADIQSTEEVTFEMVIQVSDGIETSSTIVLLISVLPLQLRLVNNTGLVLIHRSSTFISSSNLSFIANSDDDNIDVKYQITQNPSYGNIQRLRSIDSTWINVDSFTSQQIHLGQIRYIHNTDLPTHDGFKFIAMFGDIKTSVYDFRITFTTLQIGIKSITTLTINGTRKIVISNENLFHQTIPLSTFSRNIIYTVLKPPKYGYIYVEGHPEYAKEMDSFTQNDIDKNIIRYQTFRSCYSSFIDVFEFIVSVPECADVKGQLNIVFNPPEQFVNQLTFQTKDLIVVPEGGMAPIGRTNFEVLFNKFQYLVFNVSQEPEFGSVCYLNSETNDVINLDSFLLEDLFLGDIYYCHDDSESTVDIIHFLIFSPDRNVDFEYVSEVQISVALRNDNPPEPLSLETLHVVHRESKIIDTFNLLYTDPDIDQNTTTLYYQNVSVTNGMVYKSAPHMPVPVTEFSQEDLDAKRITFVHTGLETGNMSFTVTDGIHEITGMLPIIASAPFIRMRKSNASIVQEGKTIVIKSKDVSVDTNLNVKPEEIVYKVLNGPDHGILQFRRRLNETTRSNVSISSFTQLDVDRRRLIYINSDIAAMEKIKYQVETKGISTEGELLIRIYPPAYWELLRINRNQTLYVEESTSVIISRDILEIVHPNISPGDISYLVTTSPQHGYLEIQSITSDDEYNCKVFDQSTINSEKMFYIQASVNQSSDYFIFDVTNGITWLKDLMLKIIIIPENMYINTRAVVVDEGKSVKLRTSHIVPMSEYFAGKIFEYKVLEQPIFGQILNGKSKVNRFTHKQLDSGLVEYHHNGSENSTDVVKLIAISRNKESLPFDLNIRVNQINDEMPSITVNTGMQVWNGGKALIKTSDLMTVDIDSPPENLTIIILNVSGGHLASVNDPKTSIMSFTQRDINNENIVFVHNGYQSPCHFEFLVTDGIFNTTKQTLHISVNAVSIRPINNEILHVFPSTKKYIQHEHLSFLCSDFERDIKYSVTVPPQFGRILYEYDNGMTAEINEFYQSDVNKSKIVYEHTNSTTELKVNDSFYFDVSAKLSNNLIDRIFNIEISVSSGGLLRFLQVPKITVEEGETAPIRLDLSKVLEYLETRAGIQTPDLYIEAYNPMHGKVKIIDYTKNTSRFSLNDFANERVYYVHDHSDSIEDLIQMSVHLSQGQIFLFNLTIPVVIIPLNDQPFLLITQSPQMSVIEGENATITREELLTEDADTSSDNIIYEILSGPTVGALIKLSKESNEQEALGTGSLFSQTDIDEERITYIHYDSPQSTTFYFKVSDGKFNAAYEIFSIKILPAEIMPGGQVKPIKIQQGFNIVKLQPDNFAVETNANKNRLHFNITRSPQYGLIFNDNNATNQFDYRDLTADKISYYQNDLTKSHDNFEVAVSVKGSDRVLLLNIDIIVEAFIKISDISLQTGDKIKLTSSLALENIIQLKLNKFNPKIVITKKPERGNLRKIIRNSGNTENFNDRDITAFTYKDLKSGIIYYVSDQLPDDVHSLNDYFEYALLMKSVQPGEGVVSIEIHSILSPLNEDTDKNISVQPIDMSSEYILILIIALVIILIILIIAGLVIYRSRKSKKNSKNYNNKDYPPTLPQPPDFLPYNSNQLYAASDGGDSIPITPANSTPLPVMSNIPHCKIIPIDLENEYPESDMENDASGLMGPNNLPYGYDDENDGWSSSYEGGLAPDVNYASIRQSSQEQRANPLLRRNQYWV